MRYLCNFLKGLINLAVNIAAGIGLGYLFILNYEKYTMTYKIVFVIVSIILIYLLDTIVVKIFNRKYGESL